jgi:DNA-binding response OmpR family regulator
VLRHNGTMIDLAAKRAERDGVSLPLTATEFAILEVLAKSPGQPVSRERLLEHVWGYASSSTTRTVETHIWRLRKKLGDDADEGWIRNLQGMGYLLSLDNEPGLIDS